MNEEAKKKEEAERSRIEKEAKKYSSMMNEGKIIKCQSLIRGYIARKDYKIKQAMADKGFIVLGSCIKRFDTK